MKALIGIAVEIAWMRLLRREQITGRILRLRHYACSLQSWKAPLVASKIRKRLRRWRLIDGTGSQAYWSTDRTMNTSVSI